MLIYALDASYIYEINLFLFLFRKIMFYAVKSCKNKMWFRILSLNLQYTPIKWIYYERFK